MKNENFRTKTSIDNKEETQIEKQSNLIIGRNCVSEALKSGRELDTIYVARGNRTGAISVILAKAKSAGIPIKDVDIKKLDYLSGNGVHQGIVAFAAAKEYSELSDIFELAEERNESPFIIILDELEDPHNLGAIIRTAECCGAHGVIIPKRRSVGLTYAVDKASAGALEYMPVVRVTNIVSTIKELKEKGLWIYCADMDGSSMYNTDLTGAIGLVVGSEGRGVSRLVKENCDGVISLPLKGRVTSLNASVAAGIIMYEIERQRSNKNE